MLVRSQTLEKPSFVTAIARRALRLAIEKLVCTRITALAVPLIRPRKIVLSEKSYFLDVMEDEQDDVVCILSRMFISVDSTFDCVIYVLVRYTYLLRHRCEYTTGFLERGCGREADKARGIAECLIRL